MESKALLNYLDLNKGSEKEHWRSEANAIVQEIVHKIEERDSRFKIEKKLRNGIFESNGIKGVDWLASHFAFDLIISQLGDEGFSTMCATGKDTGQFRPFFVCYMHFSFLFPVIL